MPTPKECKPKEVKPAFDDRPEPSESFSEPANFCEMLMQHSAKPPAEE